MHEEDTPAAASRWEGDERYRVLFDSIDEGFCVVEMLFDERGEPCDYRFLETNPAFEHQTGLRNAAGKRMRELEPRHETHWFEIYGRIALTGRPERFVQSAKYLDDRWFDVYAFRVGRPGERKVAILFKDISQSKRAEQALLEADRAKDEFLAVLGHELRNPLAPLAMGLELMQRARAKPELIDSIRPMMQRQVEHLTRLVDDLLDVSRLARGRAELQKARLDLRDAVDAAVEQCRPLIDQRQHELTLDCEVDSVPVDGDFQRLTQVVANLLTNAAKYCHPGGSIALRCGRDGEQGFVNIRDTGYGIPPERLESLFQMFSQVPEHRALVGGGGLGIGLGLSRQLIELHGGSITARSEGLEHGSEFLVHLPLACPAGREDAQVQDENAERPSPHRRVLVVDDNVDAADSLRMVLDALGHAAKAAYDGPSALELMDSFVPEVVLLDIGLPKMDGLEVARRIRARSGGEAVRLMALTGWGQDEDKRRTQEAGFDEHLTKPVDAARLATLIGR